MLTKDLFTYVYFLSGIGVIDVMTAPHNGQQRGCSERPLSFPVLKTVFTSHVHIDCSDSPL
jgi:hypothetical protein